MKTVMQIFMIIKPKSLYKCENVGVNLNEMERKIIESILNNPTLTAEKLSIETNKTKELLKDI